MTTLPAGPFLITDRDSLLRCFDETATALFAFICRIVGGERGVSEPLLANVYIRVADRADGLATAIVDATALHTIATKAATEIAADRWGGKGSDVSERVILDLGIVQARPIDEIATMLGLTMADVAKRLDTLRHRYEMPGAAEQMLRRSELWLDDESRNRIRLSVATGIPLTIDSSIHRSDEAPGWDVASFTTSSSEVQRQAPATPRSNERRPSRRWKVGAAFGIVAALTGGFLWLTPNTDNSPDEAAFTENSTENSTAANATTDAPGTTSVPEALAGATTTNDTPATTASRFEGPDLELSPGFLIATLPDGYTISGLWENLAEPQDRQWMDSWFQLWSEPGATRTSGRWLALSTARSTGGDSLNSDPARTRFDGPGYAGIRELSDDGVSHTTMEISSQPVLRIEMMSFGIADPDIVAIATSLQPLESSSDSASAGFDAARWAPSSVGMSVLRGMEVIDAGPSSCCGLYRDADPVDSRQVYYFDPDPNDGQPTSLWVETRDSVGQSAIDHLLSNFPGSIEPTTTSIVQLGDRLIHLTEVTQTDDDIAVTYSNGWWTEQSQTITVAGSYSAGDLLTLIGSVRRATQDEWLQLNEDAFDAQQQDRTETWVDPMRSRQQVATVTLADNAEYGLDVSADGTTAEIVRKDNGILSTQDQVTWSASDVVTELTTLRATLLIISVPNQPPGTNVRVTVGGRTPRVIELVPLEGNNALVGFDAFTQLPPYTIELLDATGGVVQVLNP